jgi:predicted nucleic acid-binding protein
VALTLALTFPLDACWLARLTDDQSQPRIRQEAEAIERFLFLVRRGMVELISSEALQDEVRRNRSGERRLEGETLISLAATNVQVDAQVAQRASELALAGYRAYDALHLAAAESANADALLSTDERFVKRAARGKGNPSIPVRNPVSWVKEQRLRLPSIT